MRPSKQLFATVKSATKYLEANTPTGLTGLTTHPTPRPSLLYTYNETLQRLKQLPESSVYRKSTEALTKHRLAIVEAAKPPGYDEWKGRIEKLVAESPERHAKFQNSEGRVANEYEDSTPLESWDGEVTKAGRFSEGSNTEAEAKAKVQAMQREHAQMEHEQKHGVEVKYTDLELEPALTAEQIDEIEQKIGAGLIEEVIQVAEGELLVVDEMVQSRAWEDLEETAPPGQWEYFDRGDRV